MMGHADYIQDILRSGAPWIRAYGMWAVGLGLLLETTVFTGVIVPGFTILTAAGFLASAGLMPVAETLVVAWIGAASGDQLSYLLGMKLGSRLLRKKSGAVSRLRQALENEGPVLLLWYHYSPLSRALLPCIAGSARYSRTRWLVFDSIGVALWVPAVFAVGFAARGALAAHGGSLARGVDVAASLLMVYFTWRIYRGVKRIETQEAAPVQDSGETCMDDS